MGCLASRLGINTYKERLIQLAQCTPTIVGIRDVWLIVAAIIDMLLRLSALVAIGLVL